MINKESIKEIRALFVLNFQIDYTLSIDKAKFDMLVKMCNDKKMTTRAFIETAKKFIEKHKYKDWTIANFFEYYQAPPTNPSYQLFNKSKQYKQLTGAADSKKQLPESNKDDSDESNLLNQIFKKNETIEYLEKRIKTLEFENMNLKSQNNLLESHINELQQMESEQAI